MRSRLIDNWSHRCKYRARLLAFFFTRLLDLEFLFVAFSNFAVSCLVVKESQILLLQPLRWRCVECVIHHERDVREERHPYIYVAQTSNNRVIAAWSLCRCERLNITPSVREEWSRRVISIAATVWSFAHMPLGLYDRNTVIGIAQARAASSSRTPTTYRILETWRSATMTSYSIADPKVSISLLVCSWNKLCRFSRSRHLYLTVCRRNVLRFLDRF